MRQPSPNSPESSPERVRRIRPPKTGPLSPDQTLALMEQATAAATLLEPAADTALPATAAAYLGRMVDLIRLASRAPFAALFDVTRDGQNHISLSAADPACAAPMGGHIPDRANLRIMAENLLRGDTLEGVTLLIIGPRDKPQALAVLAQPENAAIGAQERRLLSLITDMAARTLNQWRRARAEQEGRRRMAGEQARLQARAGLAADAFFEVDHRGRIMSLVPLSPTLRSAGNEGRQRYLGLDLAQVELAQSSEDDTQSIADAIGRGQPFRDIEGRLPKSVGGGRIAFSGAPIDDGTNTSFAGCFTLLDGAQGSARQRRDLLEMVNRLERARSRERSLRRETETLLEGLRILTQPIPSGQVFQGLLALLKGSLDFEGAALIRRDWQGGLVAAVASDGRLTSLDWPKVAERAGGLPTDPQLLNEDGALLSAVNALEPEARWRSAILVHLTIENRPAWLICLHQTHGYFNEQGLGLASRLALLANQALMNEAEKNKTIQSAKLATLGEMAAGIAHEMNQPLAAISLAAQNLELILEDEPPDMPHAMGKVERIQSQTERAGRIVNHMRVFARQSYDHDQGFQVSSQVTEVLGIVGEQLKNHGVAFEAAYESPEPMVIGDPLQFEQVLINVLTNARDAIDAYRVERRERGDNEVFEGRIHLSLKTVDGPDGRHVRVRVADNGGGVPEEIAEQLFDPFFTTKEVGKGTGLGLSISYGIMRDMGGAISISNNDEGAMVDLMLKAAE
ncbi:MAG: sensor histidine kinase [Alphaproteobacteria bacterium]